MTYLPTCVTNPQAKAALFYPNMWTTWGNDHLIAIFESAQASLIYNISSGKWEYIPGISGNMPRGYCSRNDTLWASSEGKSHTGAMWSIDGINWNFTTGTGLDQWEYPNLIKWHNNRLFMYTNHYQKGDRLRYSDDYGETFHEIDLTPYFSDKSSINKVKDIFSCNGNLYISLATFFPPAGSPNLLVSTDNGETFVADTLGFPVGDDGKFLEVNYGALVYNNGWLFAQLKNGDLYRKYIGQASSVSNQSELLSIEVFPNPVDSKLNIKVKETVNIKIVNVLGIVVDTQKLNVGNNWIDISTLTKGIYFIQSSNGGTSTGSVTAMKFIKE